MEELKKEQFEKMLQQISSRDNLIEKLVVYLENNNILEDFFQKIYYTIEKCEPIYKIRYYKDENGKLLSLYDIKNAPLSFNKLERCSVYVYDEIKTLFFNNNLCYCSILSFYKYESDMESNFYHISNLNTIYIWDSYCLHC